MLQRMKKNRRFVILLGSCSLVFILFAVRHCVSSDSRLVWTMINVNATKQQADAHLIQVQDGKTILIDAGHRNTARTMLLPFLRKHGVKKIDFVFITHAHVDHYGGLEQLLYAKDIQIGKVFFNLPDKGICDKEIPWGCNYKDVLTVRHIYQQYGVPAQEIKPGQKIVFGPDTWVQVLYAFDGVHTPVGQTDINDNSLVMMLHYRKFRFLFTGDLGKKIGAYIAEFPQVIQADVLKVPHHGTESTVPDIFFERVAPRYALVPAPGGLWLSRRSQRVRQWFLRHHVPTYVNGISGDIQVTAQGDHLSVKSYKTH